jgi:uncharacterized protein
MIDKLFSSKAKVEILKLFLFNSKNNFYQRQIASLTKQPIRGIQRELEKLQKLGLIESSVQGNRIYYRANRNCPIFKDLKNILFKSVGIAESLKEELKTGNINVAFIYGSYARGDENISSDIDLMVIGEISSKDLSGILSSLKKDLMREINYVVFSVQEFTERVKKKDHFVVSVLKEKKIFVAGDNNELKAIIGPGPYKKA